MSDTASPWDFLLSVDDMKRYAVYQSKGRKKRAPLYFHQPDGLWIVDASSESAPELVRIPFTDRVYK